MKKIALLAVLLWAEQPALGQTVITCGASKGYAYFLEQGLIDKSKSGWTTDQLSAGFFALDRKGDKFDILYRDATEQLKSATSEGARIFLLGENAPNLTVLVVYSEVFEIYTFDLQAKVAVWSHHKTGPITAKAATYQAKCQ